MKYSFSSSKTRNVLRVLSIIVLVCTITPSAIVAKNAVYFNKMGWKHLEEGNTLKAIINFKNAIQKNNHYNDALIGLGKAYLKTEAYSDALELFEKSTRIDKNNIHSINGLGFTMIGLGRYNEAIKYFNRAISLYNNDLEAHYGIARLYFDMDKKIWAKRKLKTIIRINPYHYNSLLLLAEIKNTEKRYNEAGAVIEKAINAHPERVEGYVTYGRMLFSQYMTSGSGDFLTDSINEFNNALSKEISNFNANRYMGYIALIEKDYNKALSFFLKSHETYPENLIPLYNIALTYERMGDNRKAYDYFHQASKKYLYDSILQAHFEDFLVFNEFKSGHPGRVTLSEYHLNLAKSKMKNNLPDQTVLHLRRSIMMNPMIRESRELLKDYYLANDYYNLYINEIKDLMQLYPDENYQESLSLAILKRRKRLYHTLGYSHEEPVRDVPVLLVLDFFPNGRMTPHFDAGEVISNYITFTLNQFGRMSVIGLKKRFTITRELQFENQNLEKAISHVQNLVNEGKIEKVDYILFGNYHENQHYISLNYSILNFKNGVIIGDFSATERGHDNLPTISLRTAQKIYDFIPFKGRILKVDTNNVVINLGTYDGLKKGDMLVSYKYNTMNRSGSLKSKEKMIFILNKCDTQVSIAKPLNNEHIQLVEINDYVYPLQKRRAKLIE